MTENKLPKLNKERHLENRMLEKATLEQRIAWHIEHSRHCACRPMPENIKKIIEVREINLKSNI